MKVTPIGPNGITPTTVLTDALDRADELEGVVIVMFRKGKPDAISCACSLSELAMAQNVVLEHFLEVRKA